MTPEVDHLRDGADLVVGGTGRVGRMLARAWAGAGPAFQHRGPGAGLLWNPMTGSGPFLDWCAGVGRCRTMIVT